MFAQVRQADSAELVLQTQSGQLIRATESGQWLACSDQAFRVLTDDELSHIFAMISDPRNRAVLAIMACGGLRMAEVAALDIGSLVERANEGGLVLLPQRGRDTARLVPLGPWAFRMVRHYLDASERSLGGEGPLFLSREVNEGESAGPSRLSDRNVAMVVMRSLHLAGVDVRPVEAPAAPDASRRMVIPEVLRHTFVARFMRAGGRVLNLQAVLGHQNVDQTRRYVGRLLGSDASAPPRRTP